MVQLHVAGAIGGVVAVAPAANNAVAKTLMMRIDNVEENETTVVKLKLNKLCTGTTAGQKYHSNQFSLLRSLKMLCPRGGLFIIVNF